MTEPRESLTPGTLGQGVVDPRDFEQFSPDRATVARVYGDDDLSLVVWNLEPGQENDRHVHPENAHALVVLQGEGLYLREDGADVPIKGGDCVIVPRARIHGIRNTGSGRLSYLAATTLGGKGYVRG